MAPKSNRTRKTGLVRISEMAIDCLRPSPENLQLYRPVRDDDPEIRELALSIAKHGLREPIVVTADYYIVSGHRRHTAAQLAGLEMVPVRVLSVRRADDIDAFVVLLREYNRQREKTFLEKLNEELVTSNPDEAYESLLEARHQLGHLDDTDTITIRGSKTRSAVSPAKRPFLEAVQSVLEARRDFWPLSVRQIHYALLNDRPLRHASKPDSTYANDQKSYKDLCDLTARARLSGDIPMNVIDDETRPVESWNVHDGPQSFIRAELKRMFNGYWRDLMQSQPNHVEIIGEKNTLAGILRPVAMDYTIPMTLGRGYCSLPPRAGIVSRYRRSGKRRLILLIVSDHDPDGEEIAHSFARSMRDDFGVRRIHPVKVALTRDQVNEHRLPPMMSAKETSAHYDRFVSEHGQAAYEVEALEPVTLQKILRDAIDTVIDVALFNHEVEAEKQDAAHLAGLRRTVRASLQGIDFQGEGV